MTQYSSIIGFQCCQCAKSLSTKKEQEVGGAFASHRLMVGREDARWLHASLTSFAYLPCDTYGRQSRFALICTRGASDWRQQAMVLYHQGPSYWDQGGWRPGIEAGACIEQEGCFARPAPAYCHGTGERRMRPIISGPVHMSCSAAHPQVM
jgi:hypothetical protein